MSYRRRRVDLDSPWPWITALGGLIITLGILLLLGPVILLRVVWVLIALLIAGIAVLVHAHAATDTMLRSVHRNVAWLTAMWKQL
jgi:uncharacterized membrane protein HdeD (DUF308 family)